MCTHIVAYQFDTLYIAFMLSQSVCASFCLLLDRVVGGKDKIVILQLRDKSVQFPTGMELARELKKGEKESMAS